MINPQPVLLERNGVRLEPLGVAHRQDLVVAASDGELWKLWFTSVPDAAGTEKYIETALKGQADGHMLPWAVRDLSDGAIRRQHAVSRHRTGDRSRGDWLYLVRRQMSAQPYQHHLQAPAAVARV